MRLGAPGIRRCCQNPLFCKVVFQLVHLLAVRDEQICSKPKVLQIMKNNRNIGDLGPAVHNATKPKLIFIASSILRMTPASTFPSFFKRRLRSTVRIWSHRTVETTDKPDWAGSTTTSLGYGGIVTLLVIAATTVVRPYWLVMSFWMISAGRVFLISWPSAGSSAVR